MAEINTSAAIVGGAVTLTGTVMGMHIDALVGGFGGGLVALLHLPEMPHGKKFFSIAAATFLGGVLAPMAIAAGAASFDWLTSIKQTPLRMAAGALIGLFAQVGIPILFSVARRKGEQL